MVLLPFCGVIEACSLAAPGQVIAVGLAGRWSSIYFSLTQSAVLGSNSGPQPCPQALLAFKEADDHVCV